MTRWTILAVLFVARMGMAAQFQQVAALSPFMAELYGFDLATIGLLIGLYLLPGAVVAIPGSTLAARVGEKRIVAWSMVVMALGGALMASRPELAWQITGRLLAGSGGVVLNIVMTKLLVDWFAGREVATALAIFVNSWPVGIAATLLVLPPMAEAAGLIAASWLVVGAVVVGFVLFAMTYHPPPGLVARAPVGGTPVALPYPPLIFAGLIWAFYNTALAMVFSFAPTVLTGVGWDVAQAAWVVGLFMVVFSLALPLGGILADRFGAGDLVMAVSFLSFAVLVPLMMSFSGSVALVTVLLAVTGGLFALAAGPIMALPSEVLSPDARTFGMGVFFTIYYVVMAIAPRLAGGAADRMQDPALTLWVGAAASAICWGLLVAFRRTVKQDS